MGCCSTSCARARQRGGRTACGSGFLANAVQPDACAGPRRSTSAPPGEAFLAAVVARDNGDHEARLRGRDLSRRAGRGLDWRRQKADGYGHGVGRPVAGASSSRTPCGPGLARRRHRELAALRSSGTRSTHSDGARRWPTRPGDVGGMWRHRHRNDGDDRSREVARAATVRSSTRSRGFPSVPGVGRPLTSGTLWAARRATLAYSATRANNMAHS